MNTAMDTDKIKIYAARVKVNNIADLAEIEQAEKDKMKAKVEKILAHGVSCVINRQLIYNYPEQLFTDAGVVSIEHADFEGVERLALVLDAEIASTFEHPEKVKLGRCSLIDEVVIGEDRLIRFQCVAKGAACTVVLRGSSTEVLEEAERSLHDALCVLVKTTQQPKIVYGGGCSEALMASAVDDLASRVAGKEALAIEGFSRALRALPSTIADNGGFDSSDLVAKLRAEHYSSGSPQKAPAPAGAEEKKESAAGGYVSANGRWYSTAGLDMDRGIIGDMAKLCITEPLAMKLQVLVSAHEAAEMILRVDEIIKNAPRRREADHGH
jgi:T-complex protein 1 subunit beta